MFHVEHISNPHTRQQRPLPPNKRTLCVASQPAHRERQGMFHVEHPALCTAKISTWNISFVLAIRNASWFFFRTFQITVRPTPQTQESLGEPLTPKYELDGGQWSCVPRGTHLAFSSRDISGISRMGCPSLEFQFESRKAFCSVWNTTPTCGPDANLSF